MRWEDVAPRPVAKAQAHWEKRQAVVRMRQTGATLRECGKRFGISQGRVRQILVKHDWKERRTLLGYVYLSPVEQWMQDTADVARLGRALLQADAARGGQ